MKGRPPKPTAILKAQGTFRKHRHEQRIDNGEELTSLSLDFVPEQLNGYKIASRAWQRIVKETTEINGYLRTIDAPALQRYCMLLECFHKMGNPRPTTTTDKGEVTNPAFSAWIKLNESLLRLEKDFGFTPISRTRLTLEKNQPEEEDYFAI